VAFSVGKVNLCDVFKPVCLFSWKHLAASLNWQARLIQVHAQQQMYMFPLSSVGGVCVTQYTHSGE